MTWRTLTAPACLFLALGVVGGPAAAQEAGTRRAQDIERAIERALDSLRSTWEYEWWQGEWEFEYPGGEIEYEPADDREFASGEDAERALREDLAGPGEWEYEPLEGEWEFEGNGEIEYDPDTTYFRGAPFGDRFDGGYYDDGYADDDWYYDYYDGPDSAVWRAREEDDDR